MFRRRKLILVGQSYGIQPMLALGLLIRKVLLPFGWLELDNIAIGYRFSKQCCANGARTIVLRLPIREGGVEFCNTAHIFQRVAKGLNWSLHSVVSMSGLIDFAAVVQSYPAFLLHKA